MNTSTASNTLQIAKSQSFNVGDVVRVIDRLRAERRIIM